MPFFLSILQSLSTPGFYAAVMDRSFGQIAWFLIRFLLVIIVANALSLLPFAGEFATKAGQWIDANLPALTLKEGTLSSDPPAVFTLEDKIETKSGGENFTLVIDTASTNFPTLTATNDLSLSFLVSSAGLKITAYKAPYPTAQELSFKGFPDGRIDSHYVEDKLTASLRIVLFVSGLVGFGILILFYGVLINTFFIGTTFALEKLTGSLLNLSDLAKISFCATIPALLICSVYFWIRFFLLDIQFVFLMAYGIYFLLGSSSARQRRMLEIVRSNLPDDDEK
ncbi:DUF1189 family protein [Oscillatoria amoena NRMC-F 0135]|nr:DUF1189 family protein [Oscillatoria laete-virens]MDL5049113.1 DUF1189 family protein [Oscillatoria amoena NRMC-F 0135]MDL5054003.1 DUF1189 family protein [Oscillatoria laete-virens NRMC-F 0139]